MIPERGDLVWVDFDPQAGHEQAGHRPAIVLSTSFYNRQGLMICCPITTKKKGYPFEVTVKSKHGKITGVVLADHIKCLDWQVRNTEKADVAEQETLLHVTAMLKAILMP
jgi:mRNA interferase MazF